MKLKNKIKLKQKTITVPIICIILIGVIIPNFAHASIIGDAKNALVNIFLMIPDGVQLLLEEQFLGRDGETIIQEVEDNGDDDETEGDVDLKCDVKYSPGLIFSNGVPFFNINFFNDEYKKERKEVKKVVDSGDEKGYDKLDENMLSDYDLEYDEEKANTMGNYNGNPTYPIETAKKLRKEAAVKYFEEKNVDVEDYRGYLKAKRMVKIYNTPAYKLKNVIARWYYTLRNLALVVMLIILVYTGIKIVISSTSDDKAKYKKLLENWIIGIILIIFLHYIMIFMINLTNAISGLLSGGEDPGINVMKIARKGAWNSENSMGRRFANVLIYLVMIFYNVLFSWHYIKRVVKMAMLTIFAPLISVTYSIDKISDGKAQGVNAWFNDYVYTLLTQPMELIIYTVLMTSATALASENPIYSIIAIGAILPVEKMIFGYFNFSKGHVAPPNPAGMFAATAMAHGLANKLTPSNLTKEKDGKKGGGPGGDSDSSNERIRENPSIGDNPYALLADGESGNQDDEQSGGRDRFGGNGDNGDDDSRDRDRFGDDEGKDNNLDEIPEQFEYENQDELDRLKEWDSNYTGDRMDLARPGEDHDNLMRLQELERDRNQQEQEHASARGWQDLINSQDEEEGNNRNDNLDQNSGRENNEQNNNLEDGNDNNRDRRNENNNNGNNDNNNNSNNIRRRFTGPSRSRLSGLNALRKKYKPHRLVIGGVKKGVRFAGKALGATGGAIAGIAAGIATGDVSNVAKYGIAAGTAGYAAGANAANAAINVAGGAVNTAKKAPGALRDARLTYLSGANADEYQKELEKQQARENYKKIKNDDVAMANLRRKHSNLSESQLDEAIEKYSEQGFSNYKDIDKGLELEEKAGVSRNKAIGAIKVSKNYTRESLMKNEDKIISTTADHLRGRVADPEYAAKETYELTKMALGDEVRDVREAVQINDTRRTERRNTRAEEREQRRVERRQQQRDERRQYNRDRSNRRDRRDNNNTGGGNHSDGDGNPPNGNEPPIRFV